MWFVGLERAPWPKAFIVLSEDCCSVPITHIGQLSTTYNSSYRRLIPAPSLHGHLCSHAHMHMGRGDLKKREMWSADKFLYPLGCLFCSVFPWQSFWVDGRPLVWSVFATCVFSIIPRRPLPVSRVFLHSLLSFFVSGVMVVCGVFWVILVYGMRASFACSYPFFPVPLLRSWHNLQWLFLVLWSHVCKFIARLSPLFHCSVCLLLWHTYTIVWLL